MERLLPLVGLVVIMGIAYALSTDRKAIKPKTVAWGVGLQLALALLVLKTERGRDLFDWVRRNRPELASRFLFVTGDSASDETRAFLEEAGRPFLMKPFTVEAYVTALRETLTRLRPAA